MKKLLLALACIACAHAANVELVASEPVETKLDDGSLPLAYEVWPRMFAEAHSSIDLAEFYVTDEPESRLTKSLQALQDALKRGVKVRLLADAGFARTYPRELDTLAAGGAQVIRYDVKARTGGVLHAKYFVVDRSIGYLGSQNLDWRSLSHIEELGVRFTGPKAVTALQQVFDFDWALAQNRTPESLQLTHPPDESGISLLEDPPELSPDATRHELPALISLIDSAKKTVRVQVLTYAHVDGLTDALERAAARGVQVQLLTSNWELRPKTKKALQKLDARIEKRILTIPEAKSGFIAFGRVAHAKYCVVDGEKGVVSTSNWESDYFEKSRNVALLATEGELPRKLEKLFLRNWSSQYAQPFDESMTAPRISLPRRRGPSRC